MLSRNKAAQCRKSPWVHKTKAAATIQYFCPGSHVGALTAAVEAAAVLFVAALVEAGISEEGVVVQWSTFLGCGRCATDSHVALISEDVHS